MKRVIYKIVCLLIWFIMLYPGNAQTQDVATLRETARSLMKQGDFENATLVLNKALQQNPDNLDLLKDQAFLSYLKRDFAGTIETGKKITARPDADVQCYQILGLGYKAIAEYKESDKMYKEALKKFPNSGVLYDEYGDLLASNDNEAAAIKQWEKGIETDPNHSGNYYYAAKYYAKKGNIIWGLLYSEIFLNIESFSKRTEEIKSILFGGYQKLFSATEALGNAKQNGTPFEKAVATDLSKLTNLMADSITCETFTALRTRFILNWYHRHAGEFPFRLFEHQRLMLQEGYFEAYNQWLIGALADTQKFQKWMQDHETEVKAFQEFQHNVIFKIAEGQYYPH